MVWNINYSLAQKGESICLPLANSHVDCPRIIYVCISAKTAALKQPILPKVVNTHYGQAQQLFLVIPMINI